MNESEIAARLAQSIPREAPQSEPVPVKIQNVPQGETGYVDQPIIDELTQMKLMDFLDIPVDKRGDLQTIKEIQRVAQWAMERGGEDYTQMLQAIRMAQQMTGKRDFKTLYHYAKLDIMQKQLNDEYRLLMS